MSDAAFQSRHVVLTVHRDIRLAHFSVRRLCAASDGELKIIICRVVLGCCHKKLKVNTFSHIPAMEIVNTVPHVPVSEVELSEVSVAMLAQIK